MNTAIDLPWHSTVLQRVVADMVPACQVSRQELDKVRTCKAGLNKMMARVLELKQVCLKLVAYPR